MNAARGTEAVCWLDDRLGTGAYTALGDTAGASLLDVRSLDDGPGNSVAAVSGLITQGLRLLEAGTSVIAACDLGVSRSNAVAAGIMAMRSGQPLDLALERVLRATGGADICLGLLDTVRAALGEGQPAASGDKTLVLGMQGSPEQALHAAMPGRLVSLAPGHWRCAAAIDLAARQASANAIIFSAEPQGCTGAGLIGQTLTRLYAAVEVCVRQRLHLVFLSDWSVFSGGESGDTIADEDSPVRPGGVMGLAMALCESLVNNAVATAGLSAAVVRPATMYGPDAWRSGFLRHFRTLAKQGATIELRRFRNGWARLDMLHEADFARGIRALLERRKTGIWHLGTGLLTSTETLSRMVIHALGSQSTISPVEMAGSHVNVALPSLRARTGLGWAPEIEILRGLEAFAAGQSTPLRETPKECPCAH